MAEGLNRVMLLGGLCAEPEYRVGPSGAGTLKLRLATTERFKGRDDQWQERTEYHSVVVFGRRGEALSKILNKGSSLFVEGSLRTSSYDDRDGNKRHKTEVIANNVILAGGGGRGAPAQRTDEPNGRGGPQRERAEEPPDDAGFGSDDEPF